MGLVGGAVVVGAVVVVVVVALPPVQPGTINPKTRITARSRTNALRISLPPCTRSLRSTHVYNNPAAGRIQLVFTNNFSLHHPYVNAYQHIYVIARLTRVSRGDLADCHAFFEGSQ